MACNYDLNVPSNGCLATKLDCSIYFTDPPDGVFFAVIYLSYVGSTLVEGVDFIAPRSLKIGYPFSGAPFKIDILRKTNMGKNEKIVITTTALPNTCPSKTATIQIADCDYDGDPEEEVPDYERPDRGRPYVSRIDYLATRCCRYVPKSFVPWSDGIGVPVLIPPNRR